MDRPSRNALLAAEMTHRQPNRLIDLVTPVKNHLRRVFSGDVAREGVNRLNDTLRGVEQGNLNALNDLIGEIGFGGIMAGPLAKTANKAKLALAESLEQAGDTAEDIYRQTGWFRGADGKWRFEIDDSTSQLRYPLEGRTTTGDVTSYQGHAGQQMSHPELFEAYPEVQGIRTSVDIGGEPGGRFRQSGATESIWASGPTADDARSTLLHELQHAIQKREGFAPGNNPQAALAALDPADLPILARRLERELELNKRSRRPRDWVHITGRGKISVAEAERELSAIRAIAGNDAYRRLAGETEARTVQTRMGMSPSQRAERPPWEDYDVPVNRQITKY